MTGEYFETNKFIYRNTKTCRLKIIPTFKLGNMLKELSCPWSWAITNNYDYHNSIHEEITKFQLAESALQCKCNTSAECVTPVHITHPNSGL